MKKNLLTTTGSAILAISMLWGIPVFSAPVPENSSLVHKSEDPVEKKPSKKTRSTRSKGYIKVYPDAFKRMIHVVTKEKETEEIDFFVFDMQGTLILNYKMKPGSHERIVGLARGTYIYRVFEGDEETTNGDFEIK